MSDLKFTKAEQDLLAQFYKHVKIGASDFASIAKEMELTPNAVSCRWIRLQKKALAVPIKPLTPAEQALMQVVWKYVKLTSSDQKAIATQLKCTTNAVSCRWIRLQKKSGVGRVAKGGGGVVKEEAEKKKKTVAGRGRGKGKEQKTQVKAEDQDDEARDDMEVVDEAAGDGDDDEVEEMEGVKAEEEEEEEGQYAADAQGSRSRATDEEGFPAQSYQYRSQANGTVNNDADERIQAQLSGYQTPASMPADRIHGYGSYEDENRYPGDEYFDYEEGDEVFYDVDEA